MTMPCMSCPSPCFQSWWEEQAAHKAAIKAAQKEAEAAYAELARYQVCPALPRHSNSN